MNEKSLGSLTPSVDELSYLREQFVEATGLQGRIANFYQIEHRQNVNTDSFVYYKDPVRVSYTLNVNPSIQTIQKYGWYKAEQERLPLICYITYTDIENKPIAIEEDCIRDIVSFINIDGTTQVNKFKVANVATDLELNQAVLNLVPYFEQVKTYRPQQTFADPQLEHKYTKREETWIPGIVSEVSNNAWKPKIEG